MRTLPPSQRPLRISPQVMYARWLQKEYAAAVCSPAIEPHRLLGFQKCHDALLRTAANFLNGVADDLLAVWSKSREAGKPEPGLNGT